MFTKIFIISVAATGIVGTGAVGTGTATNFTPTGIEFAAGPVRVEAGNGKVFSAKMATHTPFTLTVNLRDDRQLHIKF